MTFSFDTLGRRIAFGAATFGLGLAVVYPALTSWLAGAFGASTDPQEIRRAISLEPHNARHHHRLGRVLLHNFTPENLQEAIRHYVRATQLNPRASRYWVDLASAYDLAGSAGDARSAYEKASASSPLSDRAAWAYGNFLLRRDELNPGLAEIRRALDLNPGLAPLAVSLSWKETGDAERVLREALPQESRFYFVALHYFVSRGEIEPALITWQSLLELKEPFDLSRAFPLLNRLIRQDRLGKAKEVWQQALRVAGRDLTEPSGQSLLWNHSFELDLAKGGFGWQAPRIAGATIDFDTSAFRSGGRSLRISFDGSANLNFQHLFQYVPVEPSRRYGFSASLRAEEISTDSGLRFRIFDPKRRAALDIHLPAIVGTVPWTVQETEFTTGRETRMLVVALRRLPSRKFDNRLRGTAWVDDVSLTPVADPATRQTR